VLYRGGFADVWKGKYRGRDVAVKVIRTYSTSDLQKVIGVSCQRAPSSHSYVLTVPCAEVLQGGCNMENPPAFERPATDRSDNVRDSLRNGISLDGERKHQRLREGASRC